MQYRPHAYLKQKVTIFQTFDFTDYSVASPPGKRNSSPWRTDIFLPSGDSCVTNFSGSTRPMAKEATKGVIASRSGEGGSAWQSPP
jgi:hypothetical protein